MVSINYKYPAINVVELYTLGNSDKWNKWLSVCLLKEDVEELKRGLYGIQRGMSDAVNAGLSNESLVLQFCRWQKSIEKTAKKIYKKKFPSPLDNGNTVENANKYLEIKRARDAAFEKFLRSSSF